VSGAAQRASAWIYRGLWAALVHWFRVPGDPPALPVRPGESTTSFRPSEGFLRYLKFIFWLVLGLTDVAFAIIYIIVAAALCMNDLWWISLLLLPPTLFLIIAPDIVAYIAIHLRYDTTWYVMTERSIRIRRGIWIIHEMTITFENVQNVTVRQGPLQRYFGIAEVNIDTAGGGGGSGTGKHGGAGIGHRGVIEGIDNAPQIRDLILARVRSSTSAGLGDELHEHALSITGPGWTGEHLAALRAIHHEVRALRSIHSVEQ
jgi:membrane protein YdbS with pleckstrin-like domain